VTAPAPQGRRTLAAGPLALELDDGGLRYVRLGEREILRRVYVAVRDGRWATAPMQVTALAVDVRSDSFSVDLVAEHRMGPIHFRWKGRIEGDARGVIRFEMDGEALSTFERNRVGICVLHPIETCAGQPCRVRHPDRTVTDAAFPRLISPHQPFLGVRALSYEIEPGTVAEIELEGDVFETEDQRNWSDHSFKTYSTPIDLPRPVEVKAGTRIQQAITLRLVPEAIARQAPAGRSGPIDFALGEETFPLPALGTTLAPRREPLTARERALLADLRLAHLRVELVPGRDDFADSFALAADTAEALDLPLELALWLRDSPAAELERMASVLRERRPRLATVLVLPTKPDSSPPAAVAAVRALFPGVPIAAGSNVHFTELNRDRAPAAVADALMFPSCPTVHMIDDTTVAENLAAVPWVAETARSIGEGRPLGLSPVGLRKPPCPPPPLGGEELTRLPSYVDQRQTSVFAAGWTACHIGQAARAGFARATYFQSTGWRGLIHGDAGQRFPAEFPARAGAVFPVYHVLADLAEIAGGRVLATRSSAPIEVGGIALRRGGWTRVLLANLSREPQTVQLPASLVGGRRRRLDPSSAAAVVADPSSFRAAPPLEPVTPTVLLAPHELTRIDVGD
jgi:D-apionolactonase